MSCYENAKDLQEKMGQGQMWEAFEQYYADNCVVVEANGETRNGKEAQRAAIKEWQGSQQEFHGGGVNSITANEEANTTMVESWVDVTFKGGNRWKMEEVAVQKWANGQIVHERFYYDATPMYIASQQAKEQA